MTLQYFVTASDTGNRIPIEVDKSTPADLAATKESWQTDWTSEFIGDPALEKYTAKTENGEIVVALIEDEATVKRFYKKENKIILHPENDALSDIILDDVTILGVVEGLLRKY